MWDGIVLSKTVQKQSTMKFECPHIIIFLLSFQSGMKTFSEYRDSCLNSTVSMEGKSIWWVLDWLLSQRDMSGTMGFNEFKELCQILNGWKSTFASYDRDRSGTVEGPELQHAITSMGTGRLTERPVRHLSRLCFNFVLFNLTLNTFHLKKLDITLKLTLGTLIWKKRAFII